MNDPADDAEERARSARLSRALAQLPAPAPPADGWARLRERLEAGADARRAIPAWLPTAAVAAGALLVAVALVVRAPSGVSPPEVAGPPDSAGAVEHADWQRRSTHLERLLAALPDTGVTNASTGMTTALLEDRIAFVDERLSAATGDEVAPAQRDALLRERVLLLDSLVRVRYAAALDASL